MIVIEIGNHREVAREKSLLARLLDRVAPGTVRRQVEHRVADEIRQQLADRGIEAQVRVREGGTGGA